MIGVNHIGTDGNGLRCVPSTIVVASDCARVEPIVEEDELQVHEIDPTVAARYRAKFPMLRYRIHEVYRSFEEVSGRVS